jgi:hypothetical protein
VAFRRLDAALESMGFTEPTTRAAKAQALLDILGVPKDSAVARYVEGFGERNDAAILRRAALDRLPAQNRQAISSALGPELDVHANKRVPADAIDAIDQAVHRGGRTQARDLVRRHALGKLTDAQLVEELGILAMGVKNLPPRNARGQFVDPAIESAYQEYRKRKDAANEHPRDRVGWKLRSDWWKEQSTIARGNKFNASVRARRLYRYYEVNLEDGTRLDSYRTEKGGERISRKATDFNAVSDFEFEGYCKEFTSKYPEGKKIRSNAYPKLDGTVLKGKAILEVPAENLKPEYAERRTRLEAIAKENGVEIRYTPE